MENIQVHNLNLKKELSGHPRQYKKRLFSSIDNLLNVLNTESEKEKKEELNESCVHTHLPKVVKGMCFNCYNKKGKTKKANKCEHTD